MEHNYIKAPNLGPPDIRLHDMNLLPISLFKLAVLTRYSFEIYKVLMKIALNQKLTITKS